MFDGGVYFSALFFSSFSSSTKKFRNYLLANGRGSTDSCWDLSISIVIVFSASLCTIIDQNKTNESKKIQ
jgi:hypothetical protein